jgi:hypothetical protein
MRLTAKVKLEGHDMIEVVSRPVDILRWEQGTKRKVTDGMGFGDMLMIIHAAAKRSGLTDKGFEDWSSALEDFEPVVPGADPTQMVPSPAE